MELAELIDKCKKNDRKAQFELYELEYNNLMRTAFRYKPNEEDAAGLVNLAFFKILTSLDKYNSNFSFSGWAKRILTNVIIDEYRKEQKHQQEISIDEDENSDVMADSMDLGSVELALEVEEVENILKELPEPEKMVFNLYEVDGYSHKEIAQMINVSERSSKRYLAKAKLQLKEIVNKILKHQMVV